MKLRVVRIWTLAAIMLAAWSVPHVSAAGTSLDRPAASPIVRIAAAQKCKYKTDETGNCLSPAFYKCHRDWKKCNDACKANVACLDKCEIKYAAQCGD